MVCPHCGKPVDEGEWFCPSCGGLVSGAAQVSQVAPYAPELSAGEEGQPSDQPVSPQVSANQHAEANEPVADMPDLDDKEQPEGGPSADAPSEGMPSTDEMPVIHEGYERARSSLGPNGRPVNPPVPTQDDPLASQVSMGQAVASTGADHAKGDASWSDASRGHSSGSSLAADATFAPSYAGAGEKDLSGQLAARKAYVPDPSAGPSPLAIVAGIAAVVALVLVLGRAGVIALPSWDSVAGAVSQGQGGGAGTSQAGQSDGQTSSGQAGQDDSGQSGAGEQSGETGSDAADSQATESVGGYTYQLVHEPLTWSEAKAWCEQHGGQLAQPHTTEEWRAVLDLASDSDAYVVWLGGTRQADGSFTWLDGSPVTLREWAAGEPNNQDGVESCLGILRYHGGAALYDLPDDPRDVYPADYLGFVMQTQG